uniref:MD-2-related lipid-recognition domain-containing protein n=1 Tax=Strombidinopsis acuminata TaxID=141414 RepID=A0A7S3WKB2_9SPIT
MRAPLLPLLFGLRALLAHEFKPCSSVDHLHISSLQVKPDEPVPGEPVSVLVNVLPDVQIAQASIHIRVELFGVPVPGADLTLDLCKVHSCPIPANKNASVDITYSISKLVPSGIMPTILVNMTNTSKPPQSQLGCFQFEVSIADLLLGNKSNELPSTISISGPRMSSPPDTSMPIVGELATSSSTTPRLTSFPGTVKQ